jgi:myo-inositol catabolism protein IolC
MTSLYMLAFDHRSSFSHGLLGIEGTPTAEQAARVADVKTVVYEGFEVALADGVPRQSAGLLVDEQYGADIARRARRAGVALAMPVEQSGRAEFEFEFGDEFGAHIEDFDPTFAKVLVRYNPEGDLALNARQRVRLRLLSDWLHDRGRKLLFELLVPAEAAQLAEVGSDAMRYDAELRPRLVLETMAELQDAGVEPDLWKIEGLDRSEDCHRVAEQARAGGRDHVTCIVLGRGADEGRVVHWLEQAAGVPAFVGFAVGRTLWWNELVAYVGGEIDREVAAARIGDNYHGMVEAWTRIRP